MQNKLFDLSGKIILVTGAGGHLGSAISARLAQAGAFVYLNGRTQEKLDALKSTLDKQGYKTETLAFDIADEKAVRDNLAKIKKDHGRLDGLVNNAFLPMKGDIDTATAADFQKSLSVNVSGLFYLSQQCLPLMERKSKKEDAASIVNIASMYGTVAPDPAIYGDSGMNNPPFYGPGKAALLQMTRYFATHVVNRGIRSNSVSPGPFPSVEIEKTMPEFYRALCAKVPMKRIGDPAEVAAAVHFLLSPDSSYINGTDIPVDGGWTAW